MKNLTIRNILFCTNGTYRGPESLLDEEIKGVAIDSRQIEKDFLYIPFVGAKVDGHDYIDQAFEKGAMLTLTERRLDKDVPYILVDSTPQALKEIATFYREQLKCTIVGIVGSVGKTSTKEMVASVLSQRYLVQKTKGNFNNEVGLPLTILSIEEQHEVAVVEMGISDFGEMTRLGAIAKPNIVVMTNIGFCHLEQLKNRTGVLRAKCEVLPYIKAYGMLVLNGDDNELATVPPPAYISGEYYGIGENPPGNCNYHERTCYATDVESVGTEGVSAHFHLAGAEFDATIPIAGEHNVYNAMAAAIVGARMDMHPDEIKTGIESVETIAGRNQMFTYKDATIIDDCYNANPVSMKASLEVLSKAKGRKIAILGDMGELGEKEADLHYEVGVYASGCRTDVLICIGKLAKEIAIGAKEAEFEGEIICYDTLDNHMEDLKKVIKPQDTVLVKASHFMEFDKFIKYLKEQES